MKIPLSLKKRFNTDEILAFKNAHITAQKTEIGYKMMNLIVKNDRVVNKVIFLQNNGSIYTISQSVIGTAVYHTNDRRIIDQQIADFKIQIELDKQLLKKTLYPVNKKTYNISFVLYEGRLSFQLETTDDTQQNSDAENLKIIVYNTSKDNNIDMDNDIIQ